LEESLITLMRDIPDGERIQHDVSLIESTLAAVPSEVGRKLMDVLAQEVGRVNIENRALVRVDDEGVVAVFERSGLPTRDANAAPLVQILGRAIVVALTVYFRKGFPPALEGGEAVCLQSAEALFGDESHSLPDRRGIARECAIDWRRFVGQSYRSEGRAPSYVPIRTWLTEKLRTVARIDFDLPDPNDLTRIQPGCGEYAPLVVQAWLTEALLNALKHSRPPSNRTRAVIAVNWAENEVKLAVSNTAPLANGEQVALGVEAAAQGARTVKDGHQGLAFLGYAARHLFSGCRLHSDLDRATQTLRLYVA
jgi:hypothetical protein